MRKFILYQLILLFTGTLSASAINVQLNTLDPACGNSDGRIFSVVSGGTAPYNYIWSNGAITPDLTGLSAGTYTITVTDMSGNSATASATLANTTGLTNAYMSFVLPGGISGSTFPCPTLCNGISYLVMDMINGTAPYTLNSSGLNHTLGSFNGVPTVENICVSDFYSVTVTDANGCNASFTGLPGVTYTFDCTVTVNPACNGGNNGEVIIDFNAGQATGFDITITDTAGISFSINSLSVPTAQFTNLHPGTWLCNVINGWSNQPCDTSFTFFVPDAGNICGTVSGTVYLDTISNCIYDGSEPTLSNRSILINPGMHYTNTDAAGNFSIELLYNTYTISTVPTLNFGSNCAPAVVTINPANPSASGINLGDTASSAMNLSVSIAGGAARPGFTYLQYIKIRNTSFQASSGSTLNLIYDPVLTINSVSLPYTVVAANEIEISVPAINAFDDLNINISYSVPPNPSLIGTVLATAVAVSALQPEQILSDNSDNLFVVVTGSFDPNDKTVWPNQDPAHYYFMDIEDELRYTIRFQNTGTDTAFTVVIVDTLDAMLDLSTFRVTGSSHPYSWNLAAGDILTVTYNNILLPDSNTNEPASHGLFSFAVSPMEDSIMIPYILYNTAAIYFDFNPPVMTNTEFSTLDVTVGLTEVNESKSLRIYPNPTTGDLNISTSNKNDELSDLLCYDAMGNEVRIIPGKINPYTLNCSVANLKPGLYYLRTSNGIYSGKFIKL
jgi:uncharacterized repeat protein (TIGR01451 family)